MRGLRVNAMLDQRGVGHRGFALPELAAVILVCGLMLVLTAAAARRARLAGWDVVDAENLHRLAGGTTAYASDNADKYWSFSWKKGYDHGGGVYETDLRAAAGQAVDILRRKAGRADLPSINNWFPHIMYSHLVLYDYLGQEMPALWGVSPADRWRMEWAKDPGAFDKGGFLPNQPNPNNDNKRWPYSSSYQMPPAFYDGGGVGHRVSGQNDDWFIPDDADLGALLRSGVAFPSQKVQLHGAYQLHYGGLNVDWGKELGFYRPEVRVVVLMADGSADLRLTSEANPGWQPNNPGSPDPTLIWAWPGGNYPAVYRFTREGLGGRDFGGPEVGLP